MDLNFDSRCRACLAENETMLSLFEVYEHDLTLAMILQACINTEVSENDGLPPHLCDSCILVLTQFYNFLVVFEDSDKKLRSQLWKSKRISPISECAPDEQEEAVASETTELILSKSNEHLLHTDDLIVEAAEEHVTAGCDAQEDLEFYEFKNVNYVVEEHQVINEPSEYIVQDAENVQEFKKEIMSADEWEAAVDGDNNEYVEIHIANSNEIPIKQEPEMFKRESSSYEDITKYECTVCGEAHLYESSFQQHMRVKHHMPDINCKDYASRIRIKHHKVEAPSKNPAQMQDKLDVFACEPTYQCKYCDKKFHTTMQLQQHSKLHDANKKYVCEVCGARFIRKTYLDDHKEGHSTEKKHVCKFCGKAFRRRTVLRAHKRVHTHPNHYVCELCGRAFTNSSTLKTHKLLIHIKERNFKCVICGLTFPLKSTLNKHVLRHQKRENGEKGFNCTQCVMQYRDKSSLKRHIETKHQGRVQSISCPDCPKKYTSKANLMKHRRRHHAVVIEIAAS